MDIIIFSGQSNMQGQTESMPIIEDIHDAYEYKFNTNSIVKLNHPCGEDINCGDSVNNILLGAHEQKGSLIPYFCDEYVKNTKREVLAIHVAKGATLIDEWLPLHESGRYNLMINKINSGLKFIKAYKNIFFVWLQGESDAIIGTTKENYKNKLNIFFENLKKDLHIKNFFIIRVGKFVDDDRDIQIIKAQEELCFNNNLPINKNFIMLTKITGMCLNNPKKYVNPYAKGHYNNIAMELIGRAAGKNLANFAQNKKIVIEKEPYSEIEKI